MNNDNFGLLLRQARLACRCSQAEIALAMSSCGIPMTQGQISKYERGEIEPSLAALRMFCRLLGTRPDRLLGFSF